MNVFGWPELLVARVTLKLKKRPAQIASAVIHSRWLAALACCAVATEIGSVDFGIASLSRTRTTRKSLLCPHSLPTTARSKTGDNWNNESDHSESRYISPCKKSFEKTLDKIRIDSARILQKEHKIKLTIALSVLPKSAYTSHPNLVARVVMPMLLFA